ncbi:MAG: hypothetical protein ABIJ86_11570, partial [Spirochaetota bacterium]
GSTTSTTLPATLTSTLAPGTAAYLALRAAWSPVSEYNPMPGFSATRFSRDPLSAQWPDNGSGLHRLHRLAR